MMMMMMMMMHHCHDHHRHHDPALVHWITKMFTKESFFSTILIPSIVDFGGHGPLLYRRLKVSEKALWKGAKRVRWVRIMAWSWW